MNKRIENIKLLFVTIIIFFWTNGLGFVFFNLDEDVRLLQLLSFAIIIVTTFFIILFSSKKNNSNCVFY